MANTELEQILIDSGITPESYDTDSISNADFSKLAASLDRLGFDAYHLLNLYEENFEDDSNPGSESNWVPKWQLGSLNWETFVDSLENGKSMQTRKVTVESLKKIIKEELLKK